MKRKDIVLVILISILLFIISNEIQNNEIQNNEKKQELKFLTKTNQIESDLKSEIDIVYEISKSTDASSMDFFREVFRFYFTIDKRCEQDFDFHDENKYYYKCLSVVNLNIDTYIKDKYDEIQLKETLEQINSARNTTTKILIAESRIRYHEHLSEVSEKASDTVGVRKHQIFIKAYTDALNISQDQLAWNRT